MTAVRQTLRSLAQIPVGWCALVGSAHAGICGSIPVRPPRPLRRASHRWHNLAPHPALVTAALLVTVLVAGTGLPAQAAPVSPLVAVSGPSPYTGCTAGGVSAPPRIVNYANAEVEPYVAVNPKTVRSGHVNVIGVWQQDRWSTGYAHGLVAGYSFDGGKTWGTAPLPFDVCALPGSEFVRASDPWISIGPDGRAYTIALVSGTGVIAVEVSISSDGGKTWSTPQPVIRDDAGKFFDDKESITADPVKRGVAYATWDRTGTGQSDPQPAMFSRSIDGGQVWSAPQVIVAAGTPNTGTIGNQIVVDPRTGVLYDIFQHIVEQPAAPERCVTVNEPTGCMRALQTATKPKYISFVSFVKSSDGGDTWSKPRNIARDRSVGVPRSLGGPFRTGGGLPEAAIDPKTGALYVVWQDGRFSQRAYDEVALSRSTDRGAHWTAPIRINRPTGRPAFTPSVAVNTQGTIGVTYYDLRSGPTTGSAVPADYWFTSSTDQGRHFGRERHLAGPFDLRSAPYAGGYFLGDYQGLASVGKSFLSFFVMAGSANQENPTDVFAATIAP